MRVIAGQAKGRRLVSPRTQETRPMTGRAREALFSILGPRVEGARVLDLYAGSGSLGLEALSRGASEVTFVERGRDALDALRRNVAAVGLGGEVVARPVEAFLADADDRTMGPYDLVFVDPPFALPDADLRRLLLSLVRLLAPDAEVVVHRRVGPEPPEVAGLELLEGRRYGDSMLLRYRPEGSPR